MSPFGTIGKDIISLILIDHVKRLYDRVNPTKDDVDKLLEKHRGSEYKVYCGACEKYGETTDSMQKIVETFLAAQALAERKPVTLAPATVTVEEIYSKLLAVCLWSSHYSRYQATSWSPSSRETRRGTSLPTSTRSHSPPKQRMTLGIQAAELSGPIVSLTP